MSIYIQIGRSLENIYIHEHNYNIYIFIYLFMNCRCSFAEHAQASSWTIFAGELRLQLKTCYIYTHPNMIVNFYIYI